MHNHAKHDTSSNEEKKERKPLPIKKIRNWGIFIIIAALLVWGVFALFNQPTLPPTSMQGHIEVNPPSHVLKEPMRLEIHKHMLEHSDGTGPPGVIINYNCDDYNCEPGLIENLEAFAEKYPLNVYVAPFPNMGAKIALTRLGRIQVLDSYDEQTIDNFINGFR